MTARIEQIRAADGVPLGVHVLDGDPERPALCVLHGLVSHGGLYLDLAEKLAGASGQRVVLPDRRGSGRSGGVRGHAPSVSCLMDDLARVLARTAPGPPPQMLGLSLGALFVMEAERRGLALDARRALLVPALHSRQTVTLARRAEVAVRSLIDRRHAFELPFSLEQFTREAGWSRRLATDPLRLRVITARFALAIFALQRRARRSLPGLGGQTLVLLAGEDAVVDTAKVERSLLRGLGDRVRVEIHEGVDHVLPAALDPEELAGRLARFFAGEAFRAGREVHPAPGSDPGTVGGR